MDKKYYLVIDAGNSYTKIALFDLNTVVFEKFNIKNDKNRTKNFLKAFFELKKYNETIISSFLGSVNPTVKNELKTLFIDVLGQNYYQINKDTKFNFKLKNNNPKGIGDDILGLCQYISRHYKNGVAFSFGTANLAIYLKDNIFSGAIIASGLDSSFESLQQSTALINLKNIDKTSTIKIGHDTKSALEAGYFHHRFGFILSVLNTLKNEINLDESLIIITGGSSLKEYENKKYIFDENAVLIGYLSILIENKI